MSEEKIVYRHSVEDGASSEDAMLYQILVNASKKRMAKPFFRSILLRGWLSLLNDASHIERQTFLTGMQVPQNLIDEINKQWPIRKQSHGGGHYSGARVSKTNHENDNKPATPANASPVPAHTPPEITNAPVGTTEALVTPADAPTQSNDSWPSPIEKPAQAPSATHKPSRLSFQNLPLS